METVSLIFILIMAVSSAYPLIKGKRAVIFLVSGNFAVFFGMIFLYFTWISEFYHVLYDLIFFPSDLVGLRIYTSISSAFLHIDPMHILMNMVFLFLLGFPLEIKAGSRKVIIVYLLSAIGGSFLYALLSPSNTPALGASGAISGLMGALLALYPRDEIPMFLGPVFMRRVPVYFAAGIFFVTEVAYALVSSGDGVAHTAHIGGLVAGMLVGMAVSKFSLKKRRHDFSRLMEIADTDELKEMVKMIENEDNEDVAMAWLSEFLKSARCPKCGGELSMNGNEIRCSCGYRIRI